MTEITLGDVLSRKRDDILFPRVTKSVISGKFRVGLFYKKEKGEIEYWYCAIVPQYHNKWFKTPEQAIRNFDDTLFKGKEIVNPFSD